MGSKHGKYDFEHGQSSSNCAEPLPTSLSILNGSASNFTLRKGIASIPTCVQRDSFLNGSTNTDYLSLVWLDRDIHQQPTNIDTEAKLKYLMNYVRVFDSVESCERYVKYIGKMNNTNHVRQEKILIIISTELAPTLIPHLHDLPQVKYVYIYGKPKTLSKAHQQWLRNHKKVQGAFYSSRTLIDQIALDLNKNSEIQ